MCLCVLRAEKSLSICWLDVAKNETYVSPFFLSISIFLRFSGVSPWHVLHIKTVVKVLKHFKVYKVAK